MATGIKKTLRANIIPLIAIMTAVTTVLTMFVKIPTPTRGYLNLSDTMIFFSAYAFGPWVGGIVGGLLAGPHVRQLDDDGVVDVDDVGADDHLVLAA